MKTKTLVEIDFFPKRVGNGRRVISGEAGGQCLVVLAKHWFLIVAALIEGLVWFVIWLVILGVVFPSKACND